MGPYRLRVLSAHIVQGGAGGDDGVLQPIESLSVHIAVDRRRNADVTLTPSRQQPKSLRLPSSSEQDTLVWLSSQDVQYVTFSPPPSQPSGLASKQHAAQRHDEPIPSSGGTSSLPPILPMLGADAEAQDDEQTVDVTLHVAPVEEVIGPADEPPLFGCAPWSWSAELSVMGLGGRAEVHTTLPLQPDQSPSSGIVKLGRYELRVLRCVAHHARGTGGSNVVSDYPLLLVHVQVALHLREPLDGDGSEEGDEDAGFGAAENVPGGARSREARELGDLMEQLLLG